MTSEARAALREKVARAIYRAAYEDIPDTAIAVVLEEAARVAENGVKQECCGNQIMDGSAFPECCGNANVIPLYPNEIAAAIRALKMKQQEPTR